MPDRSTWQTTDEAIASGGIPHVWGVLASTPGADGSSWMWEQLAYITDPAAPGYAGRLEDARVTLDRQRVPRATIEAALVDVPVDVLAKLDPIRPVDVVVYAGYMSGTPSAGADTVRDWQQIAYGRLASVETDEHGTTLLKADSVERRILDDSDASWRDVVATATAAEWVRYLAQEGGVFVDTSPVAGAPGPSAERYADDLWDGIAATCNAQQWAIVPVGSALELRPAPAGTGTPVANLTTGPSGVLTARRVIKTRDGYANRVVTRYAWTDSAGVEHTDQGEASFWATAPDNIKTLVIDYRTSPAGTADGAASQILGRVSHRGKTWALQAIAHYWLEPDDTVTLVSPETGQPTNVLVDSVTYSTDGLMDITTREA